MHGVVDEWRNEVWRMDDDGWMDEWMNDEEMDEIKSGSVSISLVRAQEITNDWEADTTEPS